MIMGPIVGFSCDAGVGTGMTVGVGAEAGTVAGAATGSDREAGVAEPPHPANVRRISVPNKSEVTPPEALSAPAVFSPLI